MDFEVIKSLKCKKDWYLDDKLIFQYNWIYPVIEERINGDKRIISYKVYESYDEIGIWFHSGSDYFDIEFI